MLGLISPLILAAMAANGSTCSGAAPGITAVTSSVVADTNTVNQYRLHVVVVNHGPMGQPSNDLQSVAIFQNGDKVGEKGVPPLGSSKSYAFDFPFQRSDEAKMGTTHFTFRIVKDKNNAGDCTSSDNSYRLNV